MTQAAIRSPLDYFARRQTPHAIAARRLAGAPAPGDKALAARMADPILQSQQPDGSWGGSSGKTIDALFTLDLLGVPADRATERGVNYLLETHRPPMEFHVYPDGSTYRGLFFAMRRSEAQALENVPFIGGCTGFVKTGAALYLAARFGQGDSSRIRTAFASLDTCVRGRGGKWCSVPCSNNILQGYAFTPAHAAGRAMKIAVDFLGARQTATGSWSDTVPFYPTLYALAQVPLKAARVQLDRALQTVHRRQNDDGSFGRSDREFATLAVVAAMTARNAA